MNHGIRQFTIPALRCGQSDKTRSLLAPSLLFVTRVATIPFKM